MEITKCLEVLKDDLQVLRIAKDRDLTGSHNDELIEALCYAISALEQEEKPVKMFPVSACCNAGATLKGNITEGTAHYVCTNCNNSCCIAEWSKPQSAKLPEEIVPPLVSGLQEPSIWLVITKINEIIQYQKEKDDEIASLKRRLDHLENHVQWRN